MTRLSIFSSSVASIRVWGTPACFASVMRGFFHLQQHAYEWLRPSVSDALSSRNRWGKSLSVKARNTAKAPHWQPMARRLSLGRKQGCAKVTQAAKGLGPTTKNTAALLESKDNETVLKDLGMAKMLRYRIRYFTDGAVIGSKEFVDDTFANARGRFGP